MLRRKQQRRRQGRGGRHETEIIGCAGDGLRRCCLAARIGASAQDYPEPAGQDRHRVLAGRRDRRAGPPDRRQAQQDVGPAGGRGEPPRRQRQHRRGGRGARRRPTATRCTSARRRSAPTSRCRRPRRSIRSTSFEPIMLVGTALEVFMVANADAVQFGQGCDRLRQGQSRQAELRLGRHRLQRASRHRAVQRRRRHQDAARALQPDVAGLSPTCFSGRTEVWFTTAGGSLPHIKSGKVRALAVNGPARSKLLPELPTMNELGINMKDESSWYGFFAPKGTPKAIIDKVNRDLQTVIDMPDMRETRAARSAIASSAARRRSSRPSSSPRSPSGTSWRRRARSRSTEGRAACDRTRSLCALLIAAGTMLGASQGARAQGRVRTIPIGR